MDAPKRWMKNIEEEIPLVSLERKRWMTCGEKEMVVPIPAMMPMVLFTSHSIIYHY